MRFQTFTAPDTRPYISQAIERIFKAYTEARPYFSLDIPPRSGKSNIMYCVAVELIETAQAPMCLALAPWLFLRDQVSDTHKRIAHKDIYQSHYVPLTKTITDFGDYNFWQISEKKYRPHIWSASLPMAYRQLVYLCRAIRFCVETTQQRPIIFLDEAHVLGSDNMMSDVFDALSESEAFLVSLTGTFFRRSRHETIKGAILDPVSEFEPTTQTAAHRIDDSIVEKRTRSGQQRNLKMRAHFSVPWSTAWEVGALEKINGLVIDAKYGEKDLSEISESNLPSGALRQVLESSTVVSKFASVFVSELMRAKRFHPLAAGMVIVGNDIHAGNGDDREVNRHARMVRDAILDRCAQQNQRWGVEVITMADDGESVKGQERLTAFREQNQYDVIVVKLMGLVGLDVERLSVLALMSSLRKGPLLGQALTRNLTVWKESNGLIPRTIMLNDQMMRKAYRELIVDHGGEVTEFMLEEEKRELVAKEKTEVTRPEVGKAHVAGHIDQGLHEAEGDHRMMVQALRRKFPQEFGGMTDPIIIGLYKKGLLAKDLLTPIDLELEQQEEQITPQDIDLNGLAKKARDRINELTGKIANKQISYALAPEEWVKRRREIVIEAKKAAQIGYRDLNTEADIGRLQAAVDYLEAMLAQ